MKQGGKRIPTNGVYDLFPADHEHFMLFLSLDALYKLFVLQKAQLNLTELTTKHKPRQKKQIC